MSFTPSSEGGLYKYKLLKKNLPQDIVGNVNSAYGFGKYDWFKGAGWLSNAGADNHSQPFNLLTPYRVVYYWIRSQ